MILVTWNAENVRDGGGGDCRFNASLSYIARLYLKMKIFKKGYTSKVEHLLRPAKRWGVT